MWFTLSIPVLLVVYVAVAAAIIRLVRWSLCGEPTAHGQIVGTQIGCLIAMLWPLALPFVAVMLILGALFVAFEWIGAKLFKQEQ